MLAGQLCLFSLPRTRAHVRPVLAGVVPALAIGAVAAGGVAILGTGPALGLEILEGYTKLLLVLHQAAEPHGVFERQRGAQAGMRAGGMRGIADQKRALSRPPGSTACGRLA